MKSFQIKTVDELVTLIQVIVWAIVVVILMFVFGGIVSSMLYSVMFVGQPMKSMSPIDMAFTKMLNDIVLIMASSITTIVSMFAINKGAKALAEKIAPSVLPPPCTQQPTTTAMPDYNWMGSAPVQFDEEWRAPPPPTTPPEHLEPDDVRTEIAAARAGER